MPAKKSKKTQPDRPKVGGLRTIGAEKRKRAEGPAPASAAMRKRARETLTNEFDRVFAMKAKLEAEAKIGATEKGRQSARQEEKLRGLVASLEGMNRFALQMGLITTGESREFYAEAMKRGLYAGWR